MDAGCGSGVLVPFILDRITPTEILYELDFSAKMIDTNQRLHVSENIRFMVSDVENAPLADPSFDGVICFSCFPHFHDKKNALRALSRTLKPEGVFVVSHFSSSEEINRHHESCHAVMHDHLPDAASMRTMFQSAGLNIEAFIDEPGFYCLIANK